MHTIRKFVIAGVGAIAVAMAAVAVPTAAQARWGHHWGGGYWGGGWGPGFAGGLIVGSALAAPYYGDPYAYDYGPDCYIRRQVYINRFGNRIVRHIRVCD